MKGLGDLARLPEKAAEIHAYLDANPQAEGESDGKYIARKVEAIKSILEVRADGIGVAVGEALGDFFHEPPNRALWDDPPSAVVPTPYVVEMPDSEVSGQTSVLTANLTTTDRHHAQ